MQVGLSLAGGVQELVRVRPEALADLGFSSLFIGCYEDEIRWQAEEVAAFVRRARSFDLQVYAVPWGYGRVLDPDPAISSLYVETHPQVLQMDSRGRRCPKACPNNPYFLEWFSSSMRTLAWLVEVNGFLWDEPSFHYARAAWACRCPYCERLYRASLGHEMPRELSQEAVAFRESSIVMFLLAAAAAVQAVDYRLESLVTPTPALPGRPVRSGTGDWEGLAACSACDALALFVPWQHHNAPMEEAVRELQHEGLRHAERHGKRTMLWIATSPSPRDRVLEAITVARTAGVETLVLSDYGSLVEHPGWPRFAPALRAAIRQAS